MVMIPHLFVKNLYLCIDLAAPFSYAMLGWILSKIRRKRG